MTLLGVTFPGDFLTNPSYPFNELIFLSKRVPPTTSLLTIIHFTSYSKIISSGILMTIFSSFWLRSQHVNVLILYCRMCLCVCMYVHIPLKVCAVIGLL